MSYTATEYWEKLEEFVWRLVPMAQTGSDLIGLGEVIDALSGFARDGEEHEIAINVGLTLGFRQGGGGSEGGLFYGVRVSDEGIEFDVLETFYESGIGSDHSSRRMAFIGWDGAMSGEPLEWFSAIRDVLGHDRCKLAVSRDHV